MRALFTALLVIAAGLGAVVAWELQGSGGTPRTAPPTARPDAGAPAPAVAGQDVAALAAVALARPLFSPDRRPGRNAGPAQAGPPPAPLPRLSGILVTPAGRSAIFAGQPASTAVREGARIGTYEVRSIEPGQVTLLGPDGPRIVRPSFDRSPPALAEVSRPLSFDPPPGSPPPVPPPPVGPGSPMPTLQQAFPVPGPSPDAPNGPQGAMAFDQKTAPSGLDILRNAAAPAQ